MNEKKSFFMGAIILTVANIISKILGAVFKIPLTYILKEEGMAVFGTANTVYSLFLTFVISGIPLATSRLVASDSALGRHSDVTKTVSASQRLLCLSGLLGSIVLFILAKPLAIAMKDPAAALSIKIISPSVFLVAAGSVYKSYFQGSSNMLPTAISQVIESMVRMLAGFYFAYLLISFSPSEKAAGATAGVTIGELIATAILFLIYLFTKKAPKKHSALSYRHIYKNISNIAVPMLFSSVILSAMNMVDVATVRNQLLRVTFTPGMCEKFLLQFSSYTNLFDDLSKTLKFTQSGARWLYGAYSGYALTVFHLPLGVFATLGVTILPLISGNLAKGKLEAVRRISKNTILTTLMFSVPCSIIFITLGDTILKILFHNTASSTMLMLVSPCLIILSLSQLFTAILHSSGKIFEPFLIQLAGVFLKILGNLILIPHYHIYGAIISSTVSFLVSAIFEWRILKRAFGIEIKKREIFPFFISALPMIAVIVLVKNPFSVMIKFDILSFIIISAIAFFAYLLALSFFFPKGVGFFQKNK